jgi:hypothetical protein
MYNTILGKFIGKLNSDLILKQESMLLKVLPVFFKIKEKEDVKKIETPKVIQKEPVKEVEKPVVPLEKPPKIETNEKVEKEPVALKEQVKNVVTEFKSNIESGKKIYEAGKDIASNVIRKTSDIFNDRKETAKPSVIEAKTEVEKKTPEDSTKTNIADKKDRISINDDLIAKQEKMFMKVFSVFFKTKGDIETEQTINKDVEDHLTDKEQKKKDKLEQEEKPAKTLKEQGKDALDETKGIINKGAYALKKTSQLTKILSKKGGAAKLGRLITRKTGLKGVLSKGKNLTNIGKTLVSTPKVPPVLPSAGGGLLSGAGSAAGGAVATGGTAAATGAAGAGTAAAGGGAMAILGPSLAIIATAAAGLAAGYGIYKSLFAKKHEESLEKDRKAKETEMNKDLPGDLEKAKAERRKKLETEASTGNLRAKEDLKRMDAAEKTKIEVQPKAEKEKVAIATNLEQRGDREKVDNSIELNLLKNKIEMNKEEPRSIRREEREMLEERKAELPPIIVNPSPVQTILANPVLYPYTPAIYFNHG